MQKVFLFLASCFCGISFCFAAPEANLIKNSSFENKPTAAGLPGPDWWPYDATAKMEAIVDASVARTGKASVRLHATETAKSVLVSPRMEVAPGDAMRFEVWVKTSTDNSNGPIAQAGLAFRRKDGNINGRAYFHSTPLNGQWTLLSGITNVPADTVTAEAHLGYTNTPVMLWYDDLLVMITNPVSISLAEEPKAWPGRQELLVRVANRASTQFHGSVSCSIAKVTSTIPVTLEADTTRTFPLPVTLNGVKLHEYKIVLSDATNALVPLRTLQGKFRTTPALALFPACPCYQIAGQGNGDTRLDARVNVNPAQRAGLKLVVDVSDASGKIIQTETAGVGKGESAGLNLRLPIQNPALFNLNAHLVDSAGTEIAASKTDVHVTAADESKVTIDANGFLHVDDKPEFPIGLYNSGHTEEMGRAGFTATHNYPITTGEADDAINPNDSELKDLLDEAHANGMRMMVELPRKAIEKEKWEQVRRRIETFKHHPGLLCWGSEERVARGIAPLKNVTEVYTLLKQLDPEHPFVLGDTRDVIQKLQVDRRDFFPDDSMDIGIWWWYPIPLKQPDGNGLDGAEKSGDLMEPPTWLTTTHSHKPLWIAVQSYQKPAKDAKYPTPDEYRAQCYLSIIDGVKGLFFYVGGGQRDFYGKSAGLLNKPEESHWAYVQQLAGELRAFSPVIMAPKASIDLKLSPADAPVEFTTRESGGKTYLIAANKSGRKVGASFLSAALKDAKVKVLYEEHTVSPADLTLKDDFRPFGVHVYEWTQAK